MYDIVYDTGTSLAVQVLASDNVNLKTWSRYLERLDEEFIKRSGTWVYCACTKLAGQGLIIYRYFNYRPASNASNASNVSPILYNNIQITMQNTGATDFIRNHKNVNWNQQGSFPKIRKFCNLWQESKLFGLFKNSAILYISDTFVWT